ncbi:MAG: HEAT repeat domain-containing protein, partial [Cyanobacteria bacterium P01_H01_bin.121]
LKNESFWGVRVEVASAIGKVKLDQATMVLIAGLADPDPRVRRSLVNTLSGVNVYASYQALRDLATRGDASYYVEASAIASLGSFATLPQPHAGDPASPSETATANGKLDPSAILESEILPLLQAVLTTRSGWNEVVRSGAIRALGQMKQSEAALQVLLPYTELGTPQSLRLGAIRALGQIATGQAPQGLQAILDRLSALAREPLFLTQRAVINALGRLETRRAISILQSMSSQGGDGRIRRAADEAIQRVQKAIGESKALQQLRTEVDQLKQQNQQLLSRLETLEAKATPAPEKTTET